MEKMWMFCLVKKLDMVLFIGLAYNTRLPYLDLTFFKLH